MLEFWIRISLFRFEDESRQAGFKIQKKSVPAPAPGHVGGLRAFRSRSTPASSNSYVCISGYRFEMDPNMSNLEASARFALLPN